MTPELNLARCGRVALPTCVLCGCVIWNWTDLEPPGDNPVCSPCFKELEDDAEDDRL